METTVEKFFKDHPEQKEIFDREYAEFLASEEALERKLKAKKTSKSPINKTKKALA